MHSSTDTTGLQSSTAVIELDGSMTVTCTFATGASSTGCQVTIFMMDSEWEPWTIIKNISFTETLSNSKVRNMRHEFAVPML